jgi:hypothetical protein
MGLTLTDWIVWIRPSLGIAVLVRLLEPGRKRRRTRSNAFWLWSLSIVLAVLLLLALALR